MDIVRDSHRVAREAPEARDESMEVTRHWQRVNFDSDGVATISMDEALHSPAVARNSIRQPRDYCHSATPAAITHTAMIRNGIVLRVSQLGPPGLTFATWPMMAG